MKKVTIGRSTAFFRKVLVGVEFYRLMGDSSRQVFIRNGVFHAPMHLDITQFTLDHDAGKFSKLITDAYDQPDLDA